MTITETRPETVNDDPGEVSVPPATGNWVTTGDHKRLGLLFIYGGLAAVIAACVSAAVFQLPAYGDSPLVWSHVGSRLTLIDVAAGLVIGIPALFLGLATYVVPLQLGATRLALPRLHNLSLWLYAAGGAFVTIGAVADRPSIDSLAASAAAAAVKGHPANHATQLLIVGLAFVALATSIAALSLVVTILMQRPEGMRLVHLPFFSWSALTTATMLVVASPVFLAGLVVLFFDQHYGSVVFVGGAGSIRIWAHELWLFGRPEGLLFAAAGVGILADIVSTTAGRPLIAPAAARTAVAAAPIVTILLWIGGNRVVQSPFAPVATVGGVIVGIPLALALLTWLGTLRTGLKPGPGIAFVVGFLLLIGLATVLSIVAIVVKVEGADAEAFRNGQATVLTFGAPLVALVGGLAHWAPKLWGRVSSLALGGLQALLVLAGVVLLAAPGYVTGLGSSTTLTALGIVGAAVIVVALLMVFVNVAPGGRDAPADPYDGLTLEWVAPSPPPAFNFETLPPIRSAYPLYDARAAAEITGAEA